MGQPLGSLEFIIRSVRMPTIPTVFSRVSAIASDPSSSVKDLARAVEQDQAVTARTLRVANSAAIGLRSRVASVEQACSALGMLRVRSIVLQTSLMQSYAEIQAQEFDLERFWRHTATTGEACRILLPLCEEIRERIAPEEAATAGLLHDIGIVVMLDSFPTAYLEAAARGREEGIPLEEAEQKIFGFHHSEVGAALAASWKFPPSIAHAARWHHDVPEGIPSEELCLLVAVANVLAEAAEAGIEPKEPWDSLSERTLGKLGLRRESFFQGARKIAELFALVEV